MGIHGCLDRLRATGRSPVQIHRGNNANPRNGPSQYIYRASGCGAVGFFRVIPFSNVFPDRSQGPQGNDAGYFPGGDFRKNRPRAERRGSFWSFFLREKKDEEKRKDTNLSPRTPITTDPFRTPCSPTFGAGADNNRENQIQDSLHPKFPACGAFLLKRPKGTKSRR